MAMHVSPGYLLYLPSLKQVPPWYHPDRLGSVPIIDVDDNSDNNMAVFILAPPVWPSSDVSPDGLTRWHMTCSDAAQRRPPFPP
jgi:hypothetical protein